MIFRDYINKPIGKQGGMIPAELIEYLKDSYRSRFKIILVRENNKIDYFLYKQSNKNIYWCHIKLPSENADNVVYDVVFKFYADKNIKEAGRDLKYYNFQVFSNDPAFNYYYAYAFKKNKIFLNELTPRASKAVRIPAKEKNPDSRVGFLKSVYFAYIFMEERGLLKTISYENAREFNLRELISKVEYTDKKIEQRKKAQHYNSKKIAKKIQSSTIARVENNNSDNNHVTRVNNVRVIKPSSKFIKGSSSIGKANTVRRISKKK